MVYIIHFETKYKHVQHYVGYTQNQRTLNLRLGYHRVGRGARLMQVVTDAGIDWEVARVWKDGDRNFERKIKNCHHTPRCCPLCNPKANNHMIRGESQ